MKWHNAGFVTPVDQTCTSQTFRPSQDNTYKPHPQENPARQVTSTLLWLFLFLSPEPSANYYTYLPNVLKQQCQIRCDLCQRAYKTDQEEIKHSNTGEDEDNRTRRVE